jgi:hypothetical protein
VFAVRRKDEERAKARQLRAEGWTLRRIANELGVALSSVSVWVRDVGALEQPPRIDGPSALVAAGFDIQRLRSLPAAHSAAELRTCGKCRRWLSEQHFGRHPKNGRQWWCKSCFRAYFRQRGQLHRDQVTAGIRRRRCKGRELVDRYMRHGCCECGILDRLVLELDHVGIKVANVSDMIRDAAAPKRVEAELEKCEVVCVNCHRIRTLSRLFKTWRIEPELIESNPAYSTGQRRNMLYVRAYLEASRCIDCGLDDLRVLEFDHVFGKTADVTVLAREGCSLNRLQDEVSRCEVRCGNCHRRRTVLENRRRAGYLA